MIDESTKKEIIHDLANDVRQADIIAKHPDKDISQQSISYLKKTNLREIEVLRHKLLTKLGNRLISRTLKENNKADRIVEFFDNETMDLPSKEQSDYLKRVDDKANSLLKGIVAPQSQDTNINVTKTENLTNINADVLKMFQQGAQKLLEADVEVIDES